MKRAKAISGAIESNAGDDFHILWTCRRCLRLVDTGSGLSLVVVEGVSPLDEHRSDAGVDAFLGADLTEYFGGDTFDSADRVVFSQLKYSQRNKSSAWTAARLCRKRQVERGSVIARFAQIFRGFSGGRELAEAADRLTIKLVSNQPASGVLAAAFDAAHAWLEGHRRATAAKHLGALQPTARQELERLYESAGLKSGEFCQFLRCLDLSDCDTDSRLWFIAISRMILKRVGSIGCAPIFRVAGTAGSRSCAIPRHWSRGCTAAFHLSSHGSTPRYPVISIPVLDSTGRKKKA